MSEKLFLLAVEGITDVIVIGKLLKNFGFIEIHHESDLVEIFKKLIPTKYPFREDDIEFRISLHPSFYKKNEINVAIINSDSCSNLVKCLELNLLNMAAQTKNINLSGILIVSDADTNGVAKVRQELFSKMNIPDATLKEEFFTTKTGIIGPNHFKADIYVFPDNCSKGTIDNVLIKCGAIVYSDIIDDTEEFDKKIPLNYKNKWKPFDREKALIGTVSQILKPGKASHISIKDNDWISTSTIFSVRELKLFNEFIKEFLEC